MLKKPHLLPPTRYSAGFRYGVAVALAAAAVALTVLLRDYLQAVIFVFFYPAVMAAAWIGGIGPAVLVALTGVITADVLFIGTPGELTMPGPVQLVAFAIFLLLAAVIVVLMENIRSAHDRLESQARDLEEQAAEYEQAMEHAEVARREAESAHRDSERERWRVSLLAETSRKLTESREYLGRLQLLADVIVRELAEYCVVDVVDDQGTVSRLAIAVRHPETFDRFAPVRDHVPALSADEGVGRVLRTGEPEIALDADATLLEGRARSDEQLQVMHEIGTRSYILMPMRSNDRVMGCIAFIRTDASPRFDDDDVELARVLAMRAGVLIELARVYNNALQEIERRRQVEAELQQKANELEELNVEQEETLVALAEQTQQAQEAERAALEASQAKSQFLAVMSHELRTPLNAILGYTDLLQSGAAGVELNDTAQSFLDRVRTSVLHLRGLIEEILSLSRIEAGKEDVRLERVSPGAIVREVSAMLQPDAVQKGLQLRTLVEGDVIVSTDPGKLRQILINLTSNAIKFTDTGGVELRLTAHADRFEIEVTDTGIGIAANELERIFEPFTQADQTRTRRAGGTGLGLAVSRRLARLLGGDVQVSSEPGRGSRFLVLLPIEAPLVAS